MSDDDTQRIQGGGGLLRRIAAALGITTKAAPSPATLYRNGGATPSVSYLTFPGWDVIESRGTSQTATERDARLAVTSSWVYSSISAIARELSSAELIVKRRGEDGVEDIDNHPLELVWDAPNDFMGQAFLMQFWTWQLLLSGEAYLYIIADASGAPTELWPVPSWMISPAASDKEFIDGYWFKPTKNAEKSIYINREFIVYSRLPNPFNIRRGLSPLAAAMVAVESDLAMARWNKNFFSKDNAAPTGLITVPRDTLDGDLEVIRNEIRDFFGGSGGRRVGVARAGDMAWTAFDRSQKEMEFLSGRNFARDEISRVFGIPEGFWAKDATRANAEGAKATMIENAVWPHLVMLQEDLNAQLIKQWYPNQGLLTEFEDIRPRNRTLELQELTTESPFLTLDEIRAKIGYDPIGDYRGQMMMDELKKGAPLPMTPASKTLEADMAAAEAAATEVVPEEPVPTDETEAPTEPTTDEEAEAVAMESVEAAGTEGAEPTPEAMEAEIKRWKTKTIKAMQRGKPATAVTFETTVLPATIRAATVNALTAATDIPAALAAFATATASVKAWSSPSSSDIEVKRRPLPAVTFDDDAAVSLLIDDTLASALQWARRAAEE